MGKRLIFSLAIVLCLLAIVAAKELPEDELQFNLSSYLDNFRVTVFYPNLSLTKRISENTSLTGRYLVDVITAASMKSKFQLDGITSATQSNHGGGDNTPDELRHELGVGITRVMGEQSLSLNGIYSTEHDYTSTTFAGTFSRDLAQKNTTVQFSFVRSWDKVFPQVRTWKRDKDVWIVNGMVTQVLSTRWIAQAIFSYNQSSGHLSDTYQVVTVFDGNTAYLTEPISPSLRVRRAVGLRSIYRLNRRSALEIGYRYYWDSWEVRSHTISATLKRHLFEGVTVELGSRNYFQSRAFFFKPLYTSFETYMTVDNKLDSGYSNELQFKLIADGSRLKMFPMERLQYSFSLNFYRRHTDTRDWHSRLKTLYAYYINFGLRYRL